MSFTSNLRVQAGKPVLATDYSALATNWDHVKPRLQNKGALVYRTTDNLTLPTTGGGIIITWQTTDFDTTSFWSGGSPTRLTIPSGISYARLSACIRLDALCPILLLTLLKNGLSTGSVGMFNIRQQSANMQVVSPVMTVSAADYFELNVENKDASPRTIRSNGSWFGLEVWST